MPAPEEGVQLYRPSAKVRLVIRFEEFGDPTAVEQLAPTAKKLTTQARGVLDQRSPLQVTLDPAAPPGVTRYLLLGQGSTAQPQQQQDKSSDGLTQGIGAVVPTKATWKANGLRKSDELTCTFPFADVPFDPRVVRSCAVEYYLGTVSDEEFALGIEGKVRTSYSGSISDGESLLVVPDTYVGPSGEPRTNLRFQGWVDEWEVEWPDEDAPCVNLTCRDNSSLLFDQPAAPKLAIDPKLPIDKSIATYLSNYPQFAGLSVEYRPAGLTVPKLGDVLAGSAYQPKLGPAPAKAGAQPEKMSVMDYVVDVCGSMAHLARVVGTTLAIQMPRTITSAAFPPRLDDPFKGRTIGGAFYPRRLFVHGRNVFEFKLARRFTKFQPKNIEVRSYSTRRKNTLVVRVPDPPIVSSVGPGDGNSERKVEVIRIGGITDAKTLRLIAQSAYETIGRNELSASLTTKNMGSFGGGNTDPDVLDLEAGDAVDVLTARTRAGELGDNTLGNIEDKMLVQSSAEQFVRAAGYSAEFAAAYAAAIASKGVQTTFLVRNFDSTFDADDGVRLTIQGVNYVEVRADKVLPQGEEPDPADAAGVPRSDEQQPAR